MLLSIVKGLGRCDEDKSFKKGAYFALPEWALNVITIFLMGGGQREVHTEGKYVGDTMIGQRLW